MISYFKKKELYVMAQEIKFTDEEVKQVSELRDASSNKVVEFGQLKIEIFLTKQRLEELYRAEAQAEEDFKSLQEKEKALVEELNKKYGAGTLDLDSGTFKPAE
tara:strand:+ start:548 stop:859 length:312 start_codon:yes stop_codon:yes gene_type:complete